jgi:hypothetical protein
MSIHDYTIWWLDQNCIELSLLYLKNVNLSNIHMAGNYTLSHNCDYVREELHSMQGRPLRGRLWISKKVKDNEQQLAPYLKVNPWPDTFFAEFLGSNFGGLVLMRPHDTYFKHLPGVMTNFYLEIETEY